MSKERKRNEELQEQDNSDTKEPLEVGGDKGSSSRTLDETETVNVQKKIFHAIKETGRAFKKARDFEIRKIIKRIKAAEKDQGNLGKVPRLEKELQLAKGLDVHPFAHAYVHKHILSEQLFKDNPQILVDLNTPYPNLSREDEAVIKNIVGRLGAKATVKSTFTLCLNAIYRAAGIEVQHSPIAPKRKNPGGGSKSTQSKGSMPKSPNADRRTLLSPTADTDQPSKENQEDEEDEENTDVSGSGSIVSEEPQEDSPQVPQRGRPKTVLPALSTGYIPADDLSDPEEDLKSFAPLAKPRKNRRGQRERQAIWLKKYGAMARHLHPELKADAKDNKKQKARRGSETVEMSVPLTEATIDSPPKKRQELHPSWVAKQKVREQQQALFNTNKPKKIVFE